MSFNYKIFSITLLCCMSVFSIFSQKEANIYYFGTAGLDFRTEPPTVLLNSAMDAIEGSAVMCDSLGNLLFYTNGGSHPMQPTKNGAVWNKNHQIMENGELFDTAGCNSSSQGAIFIPVPSKKKQYYLFTKDCRETNYFEDKFDNRGMRYSVIDLAYNNGLGKVTQKGIPLIPYGNKKYGDENVTAVLHQNNRDYWVFSYHEGEIVSFLVDSSGFHPYTHHGSGAGRITISPKRDYILFGSKLYKFDSSNGTIDYLFNLPPKSISAEFSPNGRFIYTTETEVKQVCPIYQFDLENNNFEASKKFIARCGETVLSLAPNGKIYNYGRHGRNRIEGAIHCPNELGLNCAFQQEPFYLGGRESGELANVLTHYLYRENIPCTEPPTPETPEVEPPYPDCPIVAYPNPANKLLTVEMFADTIGTFHIGAYDLSGRIIEDYGYVPRSSGYVIDTQKWSQGVYILYMYLDEKRQCRTKISVIRN